MRKPRDKDDVTFVPLKIPQTNFNKEKPKEFYNKYIVSFTKKVNHVVYASDEKEAAWLYRLETGDQMDYPDFEVKRAL